MAGVAGPAPGEACWTAAGLGAGVTGRVVPAPRRRGKSRARVLGDGWRSPGELQQSKRLGLMAGGSWGESGLERWP